MLLPCSIHNKRKKSVFYTGDEKCSICLNFLNRTNRRRTVQKLPCGHMFHFNCINKWTKSSCPLCRYSYFFDCYHAVDPWIDNTYRSCVARINFMQNTKYPYNCRRCKSYYNLVLYELRSYFRHRYTLLDRFSFVHASQSAARLMETDKKYNYFSRS